jgi:hypothetical protein
MLNALLELIGRSLTRYLASPVKGFTPTTTVDPALVARVLMPADVILVEGDTRVSGAIKYLTQSTWSHAALYVGPLDGRADPDGTPHDIVEANLGEGVVSASRLKYASAHTRICRAAGLSDEERASVASYAVGRIGDGYDVRHVVDLMRYLLPHPPVPARFRRRMIALGSGSPTQAICSTLIAQAFHTVRYPILPRIERIAVVNQDPDGEPMMEEILHIRHHSLYCPRDFDISPYFAVVKPTIAAGFDYRELTWGEDHFDAPDMLTVRGRPQA